MKFEQFYSSSKANLYQLTASNGKRLLIECGTYWPNILKALNHDLSNIEGCLLSHGHKDHSKAIKDVIKAGIDVYASHGTFEALQLIGNRKAHITDAYRGIGNHAFQIFPFRINHDACEPFGFVIKADNEHILFVTDTSHIKLRFKIPFNIIAIECSYDKNILQQRVDSGSIHEEVAKRLLNSHMEKHTTMRYLAEFCDLSKCREIHLLHMSEQNIDKEKTKKEFENTFFIETKVRDGNISSTVND